MLEENAINGLNEERFVELLHQLPEHIAAEYKLHASHWLLPHMLQRDEVNDRPAPLANWAARVANDDRAPAYDGVAIGGAR